MKETISIRLVNTLEKGKAHLSEDALRQVRSFVSSQMADDCAFRNKGGKSDLYYTVFGWMLCYVLGIKLDSGKMKNYLARQKPDEFDLIHYAAYMRCSILADLSKNGKLMTWLGSLKSKKTKDITEFSGIPHDDPNSPYTQFIWLSLLEDTGNKPTNRAEILANLSDYQLEKGGFRNMPNGLGASTNATVAALSVKGQLEGYKPNRDVQFLKNLQQENGGFFAASASPVPDLLSTATALFILQCYKEKPRYSATEFLEAHWLETGGFCPTLIDETSDVEYTFYGLLALGTID
ncbi:prenyltransferase/squalene oxidase repeat-containing protein [Mangrovibacterium marinum]|uniref:Prenyltransferase/squalene oxidase-like repeat protein n=1 Tax=Mangrovibacterium marinum TaxID=1639118 RepID=A0A2T5C0U6_9BACT|nr:prenyltransferase/squalene oxidase repeat-containing protein [Mangrovibacterium marinum]PTN08232.1 prenyltransferase/squalene oxidase-like repeat protein [Mangrovibacterium marinum]